MTIAYGDLAARFDARGAEAPEARRVEWFVRHLPRDAGSVLDAAAGDGQLLAALLARGVPMHGAEADAHAWRACERRLARSGHDVPVFRQPLAGLNVPFRYRAIIVPAGALQRCDAQSVTAVLERLRAHLVAPGVLIAELDIPAIAQHPPGAPIVEVERRRLADDTAITRRAEIRVDADARRIDRRERYEQRRGTEVVAREDRRTVVTWYTEQEAIEQLQRAGFADVHTEAMPVPEHADAITRHFVVLGTP